MGNSFLNSSGALLSVSTALQLLAFNGPAVGQEFETVDVIETPQQATSETGRIIVKLRESEGLRATLPSVSALDLGLQAAPQRTSGGELLYEIRPQVILQTESFDALSATVDDIVAQLNEREDVEYAQPDFTVYPTIEPDDTHYGLQWHYHVNGNQAGQSPGGIGLPDAWDVETGDASVVVAVIDTGHRYDHTDVTGSGNSLPGFDMISSATRANDGDGRDGDATDAGDAVVAGECGPGSPARSNSWHGAHVAGTVGAVATNNAQGVAGVAWKTSVLPVRVLGKCGGSTSDINDGIRWAAGLPVPGVPANPNAADVINMSLGAAAPCSASPSTQAAIDDAVAAGVTVVVAAGNDAMDAANAFPASCNNVITVAASDFRGHLVERYSNFGTTIEIMAPGGDVQRDDNSDGFADGVLSTIDAGGYSFFNGTSMAAPHVAGAAALLLSNNPTMSPNDILNKLQADALPRDATQCPQPCGAGLLQVKLDAPPAEDPKERGVFTYAAKFLCGRDPDERFKGEPLYDTIVNIRNRSEEEKAEIHKYFALAIPPGNQNPGGLKDVARDVIPPLEAIASDCEDVIRRAFGGTPPGPFVDGFLVITSKHRLDVTAVYRSSVIQEDTLISHDIDIERIIGRRYKSD